MSTQTESLESNKVATGRRMEKLMPYLLILPAMIVMIGILYPFFTGVYWSFTNYSLASGGAKEWIGLHNYIRLIQSGDFWNSVRITLQYTIVCLGIQLPLGLGVAMVLRHEFRSVRFFRAVLILPLMIPPVVGALMWKVMMGSDGVINYLLSFLGVPAIKWLSSTQWVVWSVCLIDIWIYTPFVALILLAGLQSLPNEPFEASMVDGASAWFVFRRLTLPLIKPFLILVMVFRSIDCLKIFDIIYATTKGGPLNASMSLHVASYYASIRWTKFGQGMAILVVLWAMCYVLCFYLTKQWRRSIESASGL